MACGIRLPFLVAFLAVFSYQAQAQQACGTRTSILKQLAENHHEVPRARGINGNGYVVELLTSEDGGFTIIATAPNGVSCLVTTGVGWTDLSAPEPKDGA